MSGFSELCCVVLSSLTLFTIVVADIRGHALLGLHGLLWRRRLAAGCSEGDRRAFNVSSSLLNTCLFSGLTLFLGGCLDQRAFPRGGWLGQQEHVSGGGRAHADGLCHACHPLQTCGAKED